MHFYVFFKIYWKRAIIRGISDKAGECGSGMQCEIMQQEA